LLLGNKKIGGDKKEYLIRAINSNAGILYMPHGAHGPTFSSEENVTSPPIQEGPDIRNPSGHDKYHDKHDIYPCPPQ
jgi:hypothetical protein